MRRKGVAIAIQTGNNKNMVCSDLSKKMDDGQKAIGK